MKIALPFLLFFASASFASENSLSASGFLDLSKRSWEAAQSTEDTSVRLRELLRVEAAVDVILRNHPDSDIAAALMLDLPSAPFSREELRQAIYDARASLALEEVRKFPQQEVNIAIVNAIDIIQRVERLEIEVLETAMEAYLMLREADSIIDEVRIKHPEAENIGLLDTSEVIGSISDRINDSKNLIMDFCEGKLPRSCLLYHAVRHALEIQAPHNRARTLSAIASGYVAIGEIDEALSLAAQAEKIAEAGGQFSSFALRASAVAWVNAGDLPEAERIKQSVNDSMTRIGIILDIAAALKETDKQGEIARLLQEAKDLSKNVTPEMIRSVSLRFIAQAYDDLGEIDAVNTLLTEANQIAPETEAIFARAGADRRTAHRVKTLAENGEYEEASGLVTQISDEWNRALARSEIVRIKAKAGLFYQASTVVFGALSRPLNWDIEIEGELALVELAKNL